MRETRTSGLMSGDGKRGDANLAQATAPVLDSTEPLPHGEEWWLESRLKDLRRTSLMQISDGL